MGERVVLVTGAARGIGRATVRALVDQGDRVLAVDACTDDHESNPYPLATRADLDAVTAYAPGRVVGVVADVRDRGALANAVDAAVDRWGRLDAAVAAAAIIAGGQPLWNTSDETLQQLWEIDVRGVWNTAAVAIPVMLNGPNPAGCRFVAVASAAGHHGLFHLAAYNTAKHAVIGLIKGLAADLARTGITAVAVSPGSTNTDMLEATASLHELPTTEAFTDHQLLGRLLEPAEVAATIVFCCSQGGAVLNGSVLHADGGFRP